MSNILLNQELLWGMSHDIEQRSSHKDWIQDDPTLPTESLADRIKDMIASGATLELIVLAIMTNDSGNGAMDICSLNIAKITEETNALSDLQDDLINLQRILSKIEAELGSKKDLSPDDWKKFDKSLLKQLKDTYEKLCKDQKTLAKNPDPKLKAVADMVGNWLKDLSSSVPTPSGDKGKLDPFDELLKKWDGNTDFPLNGKDLANNLCGAIYALAKNFYDKNHPGSGDANTDYLGEWGQSVQACEQLTSGTSQQETTAVQGFMQILNSFNNIGQQGIQASSQGKEAIIRNQKAG
ncbi:MAG: hypothetical protein LBC45_02430 [Chlamydiales bacterium]|jgi:hypothetical protein|nr:hypothetical protein [Chlamydiales bacterium]